MHLFYFFCDCCALPGRGAGNMIADVFVKEANQAQAESRVKKHIEQSGWQIKEIQHWELVHGVPVHDSRLGALIKAAKENGIASEFSPYGSLDQPSEDSVAASAESTASADSNPLPSSVDGPKNAELPPPEQPAEIPAPVEAAPPPQPLVNPLLSRSLAADHEALQNDLVQAQELASDFQQQLAGKSNECALLKQIIEKTKADLGQLQAGIVQLRAERHHLANEAMKAQGLEMIRSSLERKLEEHVVQLRERDKRIAELVIETVRLRQLLDRMRNTAGATAAPTAAFPEKIILGIEEPEIEITPEAPRPLRTAR
jgi:hypothetical protein